jgi:peptidylprolyl isomerase
MFKRLLLCAGIFFTLITTVLAASPENTLKVELSTGGRVVIELLPERAPGHVERIKKLARAGFYDGISFHRVIEGFMAQTGDPTGTGSGGSEEPDLKAEFNDYPYVRGTLGAARTSDPDSANSQFFICFTDQGCSFLTGQYTVFGQVVAGMEFIDKIARGEPPAQPDKIVKMVVAADDTAATSPPVQSDAPSATPKNSGIESPAPR